MQTSASAANNVLLPSGRLIISVAAMALLSCLAFVPAAKADELPAFDLVLRDAHFVPDRLEVPANTKFRLNVKNEGPGVEEFDSSDLKKEKIITVGATAAIIISPLRPGTYRFYGEYHADTAQGAIIAK